MRCKSCNYMLWQLQSRRCPECGTPFAPSQYEFTPGAVQFCCPHCGQAYYGTDQKGHLAPPAFECVGCHKPIHMDEMLLRPAEGVDEEQTHRKVLPWHDRKHLGWFKAWFRTVWMAMLHPQQLIRTLPEEPLADDPWQFAVFTNFLITTISFAPLGLLIMALDFIFAGGSSIGEVAVIMLVAIPVGSLIGTFVSITAWAASVHAVLRLTGGTRGPYRRTSQALCYSTAAAGANVFFCLGFIGGIWWLVCAVLMVKEAQKVHGARAAMAVILVPAALLAGWTAVEIVAWSGRPRTAMRVPRIAPAIVTTSPSGIELIGQALLTHPSAVQPWPRHAIELVRDQVLSANDLTCETSATLPQYIPVGDTYLAQFEEYPNSRRGKIAQRLIASLPADVIAHRLGDYVFTYHGIDRATGDSRLWLVIESPDPDIGANVADQSGPDSVDDYVTIVNLDGASHGIPKTDFAVRLKEQNRIRALAGLAALPRPQEVRHGKPATALQTSSAPSSDRESIKGEQEP